MGAEVARSILEHTQLPGTAFEQMGVDQKVAALTNSLHTYAWSRYGTLPSIIRTNKGGPQGCKLGGALFKVAYVQVMNQVRTKLRKLGITSRARSPGENAFVQEGQRVVKGQTLCLVEAMKTFNKIEVEKDAVVRKILVKDGESVDCAQGLFELESV